MGRFSRHIPLSPPVVELVIDGENIEHLADDMVHEALDVLRPVVEAGARGQDDGPPSARTSMLRR